MASDAWIVFCRVCHSELARVDASAMVGGAVLDYSAVRGCEHVDGRRLMDGLVSVLAGTSSLPVSVATVQSGRQMNEQERLAAVRRYQILDTPADGAFDRVAAIAARVLHAPIATVTVVDEDRIWFKASHGLEVDEIGRDTGLCASAICQDQPWVVEDALRDPLALNNPLVRGELQLRFYAAAPIITHDGYRLGTVNAIDRKPRSVTRAETETLEDLAAIVAESLELRLAAQTARP